MNIDVVEELQSRDLMERDVLWAIAQGQGSPEQVKDLLRKSLEVMLDDAPQLLSHFSQSEPLNELLYAAYENANGFIQRTEVINSRASADATVCKDNRLDHFKELDEKWFRNNRKRAYTNPQEFTEALFQFVEEQHRKREKRSPLREEVSHTLEPGEQLVRDENSIVREESLDRNVLTLSYPYRDTWGGRTPPSITIAYEENGERKTKSVNLTLKDKHLHHYKDFTSIDWLETFNLEKTHRGAAGPTTVTLRGVPIHWVMEGVGSLAENVEELRRLSGFQDRQFPFDFSRYKRKLAERKQKDGKPLPRNLIILLTALDYITGQNGESLPDDLQKVSPTTELRNTILGYVNDVRGSVQESRLLSGDLKDLHQSVGFLEDESLTLREKLEEHQAAELYLKRACHQLGIDYKTQQAKAERLAHLLFTQSLDFPQDLLQQHTALQEEATRLNVQVGELRKDKDQAYADNADLRTENAGIKAQYEGSENMVKMLKGNVNLLEQQAASRPSTDAELIQANIKLQTDYDSIEEERDELSRGKKIMKYGLALTTTAALALAGCSMFGGPSSGGKTKRPKRSVAVKQPAKDPRLNELEAQLAKANAQLAAGDPEMVAERDRYQHEASEAQREVAGLRTQLVEAKGRYTEAEDNIANILGTVGGMSKELSDLAGGEAKAEPTDGLNIADSLYKMIKETAPTYDSENASSLNPLIGQLPTYGKEDAEGVYLGLVEKLKKDRNIARSKAADRAGRKEANEILKNELEILGKVMIETNDLTSEKVDELRYGR